MSASSEQDRFSSGKSGAPAKRGLIVMLPLVLFIALAGFFAYALSKGDPSTLPSALLGKNVPQFTLPPIEGLKDDAGAISGFADGDLKQGKVSLVNVWASWCGPCIAEHPVLVRLGKLSKAPIYGLNYKDKATSARRFLARYGNPYRAVGADRAGRVGINWGVYGVPETFIVDGAGRIVYKHVGPLNEEVVQKVFLPRIEALRKGAKSS